MPPLLEFTEQASRAAQGLGVAGHTLGAAVFSFGDQPGTFEDGHMFLDGGKRHVVAGGKLADGCIGVHDPLQDVAPRGIGERPEQLVQAARRLAIYNHMVVDSSTDLRARLRETS